MQPVSEKILSVSQFTRSVKDLLETQLPQSWIRGEVSNLRTQSSGHTYFTLKDSDSQLSCVLFRSDALRNTLKPQEGQQLLAFGEVSVYEPRGSYQLITRFLLSDGVGKLQLEFQRLKDKLQSEGLFDPAKKRLIPSLPQSIGVITSPTGAAVQDFISIIKRRNWRGSLTILPALVQGNEAPPTIIKQLQAAYKQPFDLLVLTRGGGSLEDLWSFNDEKVVRTLAQSPIPTLSAVGHEIDFTLSDFTADLRAETPSAAAEMISSNFIQYQDSVASLSRQFTSSLTAAYKHHSQNFAHAEERFLAYSPKSRIEFAQLKHDDLQNRLQSPLTQMLPLQLERLQQFQARLQNASIQSTLNRGFTLMKTPSGKFIKQAQEIGNNKTLITQFADNEVEVTIP